MGIMLRDDISLCGYPMWNVEFQQLWELWGEIAYHIALLNNFEIDFSPNLYRKNSIDIGTFDEITPLMPFILSALLVNVTGRGGA